MKREDLFDILGDIDDQYIKDAHKNHKGKRNVAWTKWAALASCFALLLVVSFPMVNSVSPVVDDNTPSVESSQIENDNDVEVLQSDKEEVGNMQEEQTIGEELQSGMNDLYASDCLGWIVYEDTTYIQDVNFDTVNLESNAETIELGAFLGRASEFIGYYQNEDACDGDLYSIADYPDKLCLKLDNGGTIWLGAEELENSQDNQNISTDNMKFEDIPADSNGEYNEAIDSSDFTEDIFDIFGGSYTDDSGKFVIVLTQDTPENRTAICKELDRNENSTTFVTGTYTLAYLTELQTKISNAMIHKEIPFVVSSSLRETTNNIVVGVTTKEETELAKLYALDTVGGAIQVEYIGGGAVQDLLVDTVPKDE